MKIPKKKNFVNNHSSTIDNKDCITMFLSCQPFFKKNFIFHQKDELLDLFHTISCIRLR
jgi:hypothetical protein